ncbi:unnamed protein product, partial [Ectocarpus sp. 12 AP-2014]
DPFYHALLNRCRTIPRYIHRQHSLLYCHSSHVSSTKTCKDARRSGANLPPLNLSFQQSTFTEHPLLSSHTPRGPGRFQQSSAIQLPVRIPSLSADSIFPPTTGECTQTTESSEKN